jgi:uncharacterized integral membrane protein (TIGR00698 family)
MSELTVKTSEVQSEKKPLVLHEDWVVVILGTIFIAITLLGIVVPVPSFSWKESEDLFSKVLSAENILKIVWQFVVVLILSSVGALLTGKSVRSSVTVFPVIYVLTVVALILAGNSFVKSLNLEAVIFSLSIGLIVGNFTNLPEWFRNALSTELFVKTGLVLLGTGVIFSDILKAGSLGLLQALVVVVSVWYFAYWVCRKLNLDNEITMMISSAVSICGVSAAIATAGAIKGDTKKLSYVISLVLVTAIPMMVFMPYLAQLFQLKQEVTGAWLGGSIDTTGAVVASGSLVGETALKISTIVKFSQNVLLGIAAFAISIYWTYSNQKSEEREVSKPTLGLIWERFPKFVLAFVGASLLFSFAVSQETVSVVKDSLKSVQTLWFVLAFTSIGLETRFSDLFNSESRKPLYAFLIAQTFNIIITLVIAYILFN